MQNGALSMSMHRALHSSAAAAHAEQTSKDVDEINALFVEARDEIEFALEEADTVRGVVAGLRNEGLCGGGGGARRDHSDCALSAIALRTVVASGPIPRAYGVWITLHSMCIFRQVYFDESVTEAKKHVDKTLEK